MQHSGHAPATQRKADGDWLAAQMCGEAGIRVKICVSERCCQAGRWPLRLSPDAALWTCTGYSQECCG